MTQTVPSAPFTDRHIGPTPDDATMMLQTLGYDSLEALIDTAIPKSIRQSTPLDLPAANETEVLGELRRMASRNIQRTQMIGQGFYDTVTPAVIRRNVVENPAWYTAYTPYQPEISQGRLEALLNFQTMVMDLTALPIANASLLDEASAAAEAVLMMRRANKRKADGLILVDANTFPQNLAVIETRSRAVEAQTRVVDLSVGLSDELLTEINEVGLCGIVVQQPANDGSLVDHTALFAQVKELGGMITVIADLLALTLIQAPGEQGADIAVGSTQRFGVPLFYGGPHAAYMAVSKGLERSMPGRLVGVSTDDVGRPAYRLALQTREQHIRREKATSNICTAQALLAICAGLYAVYHGPSGLKRIAQHAHRQVSRLAATLTTGGYTLASQSFFDTIVVELKDETSAQQVFDDADAAGINVRRFAADRIGISADETTTEAHLSTLADVFGVELTAGEFDGESSAIPEALRRTSDYLTHPIFHSITSETQMMRYLRTLSDRDLALDRTMIPLGSCTMKLNSAVEMESITWPEFASIHPYVPASQAQGWRELIDDLEAKLVAITGYAGISVQPNAGSQGEYAGLLAIRRYHDANGDRQRTICLIPASAHGTNAASAVLAGMSVVVVKTAEDGTIDAEDLDAKIDKHGEELAAIMITYPSTHGVYEGDVRQVCDKIHAAGGQVYIDGANLNALVGLAQPGEFGGDVSHLNLHKTFCIPHGGGGPGVGPIGVGEHLLPYLPGDATGQDDAATRLGAPVTATVFGSAGVLPISWAYIALMGGEGLTKATGTAILNANYLARRLSEHYPILYTGAAGLVAHECILDLRELSAQSGVTVDDVAKRLIDFGFHAPTMAFPVAGTLMVEPTESEDLAEIERFIEAMAVIRDEIQQVIDGAHAMEESPLRRAPHTAAAVITSDWDRPYTREQGAFPVASLRQDKYFAPVGRVNQAAGDRNLVCACPPPEAFETVPAEDEEN